MKITKIEAAVRQLDVAARLFLEGDHLASLTLAGAAEEILGRELGRRGEKTSLHAIADFHRPDTDPALGDVDHYKLIARVANGPRNSAKHFGDADEAHVDVDPAYPLQMLMRALPMCTRLGIPLTASMDVLRVWIGAHPEALE